MSNVIPLTGPAKGETPSPSRPCPPTPLRAALTGSAGAVWRFARRWAEGLGWLVIAASIIAALR
jgi:hypothetical protein